MRARDVRPGPARTAHVRPRHVRTGRPTSTIAALALGSTVLVGCTIGSAGPGGSPDSPPDGTAQPSPPTQSELSAPDGEGIDPFYGQELAWSDCGDGFECATLQVPLDYADPAGATIEIAVNRLPAAGTDRIGSLVLNPGGPGGSGLEFARTPDVVTAQVLEAYDLVGFDPRGVGQSTPIDCLDDAELDVFLAIDASPDDDAEAAALDESSSVLAAGCEERSGEMLPHMGTVDVARDLDVLRGALGDEQLNYLGKSYGTLIGSLYAEQFPERVGRVVLDGVVDPAKSSTESALGQAAGFDLALRAFLENCQIYLVDCPLIGDIDEGAARIGAFLAEVDAEPVVTASGRELTESLAVLGLAVTLYDTENGWPLARQALREVFEDGTAETLLLLSDFYTERQPDGSYGSNSNEVIYVVNCMDQGAQPGIDESIALLPEFEAASPVFGPYVATGSVPCAHWPVEPTNEPHEIVAAGAAPILVIGTTGDPATPYESSVALAESLESGVLLTFEGNGHTAYAQGNTCIDERVDLYFLSGATPPEGTTC